ncbi:MAG: metallophosphoesterase [Deltaproteobacteria bacterium]|nr:metallophosphoesterase [Deltaproteobacteria bacterium]MBI3296430.1 metallophosphoesterase [Deltaproteobacteria bacterium]
MKKIKLIMSDFHVGRGPWGANGSYNILEDFFQDGKFRELLRYHSQGEYADAEVELIFNGDILNLIQCDFHGHYPVIITETVSTHKLANIIKGHPVFFKALKEFLSQKKHFLTYVIGNHDQEMLWPKAREQFEKAIGAEVNWRNIYYQVDGIHVEHGHQYEAVNRIDPSRLFLTENLPEPILNLPWGTLFTIQFLLKVKAKRPALDKVRPFKALLWWSLVHDTYLTLSSLFKLACYFLSTRFSKNRYRQSSLKMTLKILKEASVFPELADSARQILRSSELHTVVFGHSHVYMYIPVAEGKTYINTGTWTDIISMDIESFARQNRLTYVRVEYDGETVTPLLRYWIGVIPVEDDAIAS